VISCLLDAGADASAKESIEDGTALHAAAHRGRGDVVELLLKHIDVNVRDGTGKTPLFYAAKSEGESGKVIEVLLKAGANAMLVDKDEQTPVHEAAQLARTATVALMIKAGLSPGARAEDGKTPLHCAAHAYVGDEVSMAATAQTLIEAGGDVNAETNHSKVPLHEAAGHALVVEVLLKAGASPTVECEYYGTPLHCAAKAGDVKSMTLLLEAGANRAQMTKSKETLLHLAAESGSVEAIELALCDVVLLSTRSRGIMSRPSPNGLAARCRSGPLKKTVSRLG
jgi:ankyrin repeat protein